MHDSLCPNIPCDCEPDDYGHMMDCTIQCLCDLINKVRNDTLKQSMTDVLHYAQKRIEQIDDVSVRANMSSAFSVAAERIDTIGAVDKDTTHYTYYSNERLREV